MNQPEFGWRVGYQPEFGWRVGYQPEFGWRIRLPAIKIYGHDIHLLGCRLFVKLVCRCVLQRGLLTNIRESEDGKSIAIATNAGVTLTSLIVAVIDFDETPEDTGVADFDDQGMEDIFVPSTEAETVDKETDAATVVTSNIGRVHEHTRR